MSDTYNGEEKKVDQQLIISVGREFGSGGHEIADRLSKLYNLPLYDHNLLNEVAEQKNIDSQALKEFDEVKRNKLLSRTVRGMSSSSAENVANLQFNFLREKAAAGESFVIVGRCSESILKGNEALISIFILGDRDKKRERVQRIYNKTAKEAEILMDVKDRKRKQYHNSYCEGKWGDSRNYNISVNSSVLGIDETVRILSDFIDVKQKQRKEQAK